MLSILPLLLALTSQQGRPVITLEPITPNEIRLINREDILRENTAINLAWRATHGNGFNYQVTYDRRTTQGDEAPLVLFVNRDDAVTAQGVSRSGQRNIIVMRPSDIAAFIPGVTVSSSISLGGFNVAALNNFQRNIVINVFPSGNPADENTAVTQSFTFTVDTVRPPPPDPMAILPGESRLTVEFDRAEEIGEEEIQFAQVVYCVDTSTTVPVVDPDGTRRPEPDILDEARARFVDTTGFDPTGGPFELEDLPCDELGLDVQFSARLSETLTEFAIEDGLRNGFPTLVGLRSIDSLENSGEVSNVLFGVPREVDDFFERFNDGEIREEGGFCFVATAAYGDYDHPMVRVLRLFRDRVLADGPLGRGFIAAYYAEGPAWAEWIRETPGARAGAQFGLLFLTGFAGLLLLSPLLAGIGVMGGLFLRALRRSGRRTRRRGAGLVGLLLLGLSAEPAHALERPEPTLPIGIGLEFKAGPLQPAMATDVNNTAFVDVFRDGGTTKPLFQFGTELQLLRTSFGSFGVFGSIGYARWEGNALTPDTNPPQPETDTTTLNLLPLTGQLFYRADFIIERTPVPLVPYVRGGLAYDIYWTTDGSGNISEIEDEATGETFRGLGGKLGYTGTVGLALYLNFIDNRSSRKLYNTTRIRGTYVFGEFVTSVVDGFGEQGFDFSDGTWNLGLFVEL